MNIETSGASATIDFSRLTMQRLSGFIGQIAGLSPPRMIRLESDERVPQDRAQRMEMKAMHALKRNQTMKKRTPRLAKVMADVNLAQISQPTTTRQRFGGWMINEGYSRLAVAVFVLLHILVFAFAMVQYSMDDNLTKSRDLFGVTLPIAKGSAYVLLVDVALILLPVCHSLVSFLRRTPLNGVIPLDQNVNLHKFVAWSIVFFAWVHAASHWNNFAQLAKSMDAGVTGWALVNFTTGVGITGWTMLLILMLMVATSLKIVRRKSYERFWYTHHLFMAFLFLWSIHGDFCLIKSDRPPYCKNNGKFWKYWIFGGVVYLFERLLREWRGRKQTFISKVIQHPSSVMEIQIKKQRLKPKAGQYIFICCPEISLWQYHPFTLTSAPEEDHMSIHIRCVGSYTSELARKLGCNFDKPLRNRDSRLIGLSQMEVDIAPNAIDQPVQTVLPRVYVDGPFGSASEDVFKFEVAVLVGAGIGVTPFASILKSIWYRVHLPNRTTRLSKVYFFWICRDFGSFEWFRSLLLAIEAKDISHLIEIHTYITMKIKPDDASNIFLNEADADLDAITGLQTPTNFGRPNWNRVFTSIRTIHPSTDVGVFVCGPKQLSSQVHVMCNKYSAGEEGTRFFYGKENF